MVGLLERSRIPLSLVPERFVQEAAREEGVKVEELVADQSQQDVVLLRDGLAGKVLNSAVLKWWEILTPWQRIPFSLQHQQQTQWCWAAVSVSVSHYYVPWSTWTQCEMVNQELGQTTCCVNGSTSQCNQPNVLSSPLQRVGAFDRMTSSDAGMNDIAGEIDAGRPLCWRIGWSGGGGHFAVIEGYRRLPAEWVAVDDPWYGASDLPLSTLTTGGYQGTGDWTHTYFTRRPPFFFPLIWPEREIRIPIPIWTRVRQLTELGGGGE